MVEKKMEKKESCKCLWVKISFWTMLGLFVLMLVFSYFKLGVPSLIAGALFVISLFFVYVTSIKAIAPEKSMAYIALGIALMFILYLLLSASFVGLSSGMLG